MATTDTDDGEIERPTEDENVLVTAKHRYETHHRIGPDGETPPCAVNGNDDPEKWDLWPVEKARTWTEPCKFEPCYGGP